MTRPLRRSALCLNCQHPVDHNFCSNCGQENTDYRVSLRRLLGDLADEVFQLESRLWRSLKDLVIHPGRLAADYNAGRRVRYTTPLRLYLLAAAAYFFVAAVLPFDYHEQVLKLDAQSAQLSKPPTSELDRKIREKLGALGKSDPGEIIRRAQAVKMAYLPRAMVVLVPLFALFLMMFFRGRFYVEHLVLSLHMHAFSFILLTLVQLSRQALLGQVVLIGSIPWTVIAFRVVYREPWARIAWKSALLSLVYSIAAAIIASITLLLGFWLSY